MPEKILNIQSAIKSKITVKELLKSRGVVDEKGVIEKAASKKGFDINKSIEAFMSEKAYAPYANFYKKPLIADMEHVFVPGHGGEVATIAVMAVAVAVVAVAAAAITDTIREELVSKAIIHEVNQMIR